MGKPDEIEFAKLLFGGIGVMVFLALTIVIFVLLYQRKPHLQQADLHRLELVHQKKILESIVTAQENERERIARDLHDEVGASLSAVKLFINQMQYETELQEMKGLAKQSGEILGDIVRDVRQIAHNLSPVTLENFGFTEAVRILLRRLRDLGIATEADIRFHEVLLSEYQQLTLYRIIQEILGNVLKHASATSLALRLVQSERRLLLRVEDNGKGFDKSEVLQSRTGIGMAAIKTRSDLLGGELRIVSALGLGTCIELEISV